MKPKRTNREVYPQALRLACAKEAVASQVGPGGFFCVQGFSRVLGIFVSRGFLLVPLWFLTNPEVCPSG